MLIFRSFWFLIALIALTACVAVAPEASPATTTGAALTEAVPEATMPAALADTLGNLTYAGIFPDRPVTLTHGYYDYGDSGMGRSFVRFVDRLTVRGDLNGDGAEDAVVLLEDNTGGTAHFLYAAAVLDARGNPTPTEAVMVGDRIGVKSLVIDESQVVVDIVAQGPGDAACCASWNVRKRFALEGGRLVERSSNELSKISLHDLDGTRWRLVDLKANQEPALPDTEITMQVADGQISGFAGCNDYDSTVASQEGSAQSFIVGSIVITKSLCPAPAANQEASYLARLGRAVAWSYDAGYLAITYATGDGAFAKMVFAPYPVGATLRSKKE